MDSNTFGQDALVETASAPDSTGEKAVIEAAPSGIYAEVSGVTIFGNVSIRPREEIRP